MSDIWTMMWKESKDQLFQERWQTLFRPLILIGVVGILLPAQLKLQWLQLTPTAVLIMLYVPIIVIISFIGDSIAGERERHTLETLLASRMPDRAILLGKVIVTVGYTWGILLVSLLLGLIVANLAAGKGSWVFYNPFNRFLEVLALSFVATLLAASAGVLVSLHVPTVRQAQQTLAIGAIVLVFGGLFLVRSLPADLVTSLSYSQVLLIAIAVLAILDAVLLGLSLASFQRSRLILS